MSDLKQALEASIVEDPDDIANHAAYADFLQDQGDPRGEFIRVQLALEDDSLTNPDDLLARERELRTQHDRTWLGDLAPYLLDNPKPDTRFAWRRGWLDTLRIEGLSVEFSRALNRSPQLAALQTLSILSLVELPDERYSPGDDVPYEYPDSEHEIDYAYEYVCLCPIQSCPHLGNVRDFEVGSPSRGSRAYGGPLVNIIASMTRLERLSLNTREVDLSHLFSLDTLSNLKELNIFHNDDVHPLSKLAENPTFENLETLRIFPHSIYEDLEPEPDDPESSFLPASEVRALCCSPYLSKLRRLELKGSSMGDYGCEALVESGMLDQLDYLVLRHGCITEAGVRVLTECESFRKLKGIDLAFNGLDESAIEMLKATRVSGEWKLQYTDDDIAYHEYLYQGDVE